MLIFLNISGYRDCHYLSLLLEELGLEAAALHSFKSQSLRLAAIHRFKSGKVPILLATDVGSRGLDIPTVDLVINYNIPRCYFSMELYHFSVLPKLYFTLIFNGHLATGFHETMFIVWGVLLEQAEEG